jgi:ribosomal protein S18 acetylase RimI-like enzyme
MRGLRLYQKFGFKIEAYEEDAVYIDGSRRKDYLMVLELAHVLIF